MNTNYVKRTSHPYVLSPSYKFTTEQKLFCVDAISLF